MNDTAMISLFAGVGGFDLAARNLGIPVLSAVEIDDNARGVIAHQFPETKLFTDVCEVTGKELLNGWTGTTILVGGFPCQDLSVAGKRAGLGGERSGLFWEIIRLADELKPTWLVLENVPGLLSSNGGRDMGTVIGALGDLGYGIGYRVLDAQFFGVPQRRRRVFIVGHFGDDGRTPAQVLAIGQSSGGNSAKGKQKGEAAAGQITNSAGISSGGWQSVADITGCLSPGAHPGGFNGQDAYTGQLAIGTFVKAARARNVDDAETWREDDTTPTLNVFDNGGDTRATILAVDNAPIVYGVDDEQNGRPELMGTLKARATSGGQQMAVVYDDEPVLMRQREGKPGGGKDPLLSGVSLTIATNNDQTLFQPIGFQPTDGGFANFNDDNQSTTLKASDAAAVAYSVREDAQANNFSATELEVTNALQAHQPSVQSHHAQTFITSQTIVRRLTPTECERLQGFPNGWTAQRIDHKTGNVVEQKDSARYKQMGNAVAVPCVQWIMSRIIQ